MNDSDAKVVMAMFMARKIAGLAGLILFFGVNTLSLAELQPRDLDGDPNTIEAVYDTDRDITWAANANLWPELGFVHWEKAVELIAALNAENYLGFNDWRLPTTHFPDETCDQNPDWATGFGCSGSEMGHLFYEEFGARAETSVIVTGDPAKLAMFENIRQEGYWSLTAYPNPNVDNVYSFGFDSGGQGGSAKDYGYGFLVWPVRSGDVLVEVCDNGLDDDGDGLIDQDDPQCPAQAVGLMVRCTHDPIYPAAQDKPVTIIAEALDASGDPVEADTLEIWVGDTAQTPTATVQNSATASLNLPSDQDFHYSCRVKRGTEEGFSGWRRVSVGPHDLDFPAIPVMFHGDLSEKIDIVFFRDDDEYTSTTDPDFIRDVQLLIYGGYFTIPWFVEYQDYFNFWIGTDMANSGPDPEDTDPSDGVFCLREAPDNFKKEYSFADSAGIAHASACRDNAGQPGVFSIEADPTRLQVVAHETGHRPFGLADEYCCDGGYFTKKLFGPPFPNLFKKEAGCRTKAGERGFDPDHCRSFVEIHPQNRDWWLFEPKFKDMQPQPRDLMQQRGCISTRKDRPRCGFREATLTGPDADPNGSVACLSLMESYRGNPDGTPYNGDDTYWYCTSTGSESESTWFQWASIDRYNIGDTETDRLRWMLQKCREGKC